MNPLTFKSTEAGRWDFFQHAERRAGGVHPHDLPAHEYSGHFPAGTSLAAALKTMWSMGMPKSSARAGCYEVQMPDGVFNHIDGNRIDLSTPRRAAKVIGATWDEMERAQEALEQACETEAEVEAITQKDIFVQAAVMREVAEEIG